MWMEGFLERVSIGELSLSVTNLEMQAKKLPLADARSALSL